MAQVDTRHMERNFLARLYKTQYYSKIPKEFITLISDLESQMEKEDVQDVRAKFEEWKKQIEA